VVGLTGKSLAVEVAGLWLRSPTLNASGASDVCVAPQTSLRLRRWSCCDEKPRTRPRNGHINPTLIEVEGGVLNAMGLPNPGVDGYIDEIRELKHEGVPVIASFFASTVN